MFLAITIAGSIKFFIKQKVVNPVLKSFHTCLKKSNAYVATFYANCYLASISEVVTFKKNGPSALPAEIFHPATSYPKFSMHRFSPSIQCGMAMPKSRLILALFSTL